MGCNNRELRTLRVVVVCAQVPTPCIESLLALCGGPSMQKSRLLLSCQATTTLAFAHVLLVDCLCTVRHNCCAWHNTARVNALSCRGH
jgi:hypothetical protein